MARTANLFNLWCDTACLRSRKFHRQDGKTFAAFYAVNIAANRCTSRDHLTPKKCNLLPLTHKLSHNVRKDALNAEKFSRRSARGVRIERGHRIRRFSRCPAGTHMGRFAGIGSKIAGRDGRSGAHMGSSGRGKRSGRPCSGRPRSPAAYAAFLIASGFAS